MVRPRLGPQRQPWKGIDANERAYNTVHNALVGIILDGVTGVSPDIGHRQITPEKADEYLERGRRVLADFESQNLAPGGQRGRGQFWMENKIRELKRLLSDAEAVRSGAKPQKQTPESYGELRKHLGAASPGKNNGVSVGDHVTAEWTWGHQRFQAAGEVAKVSGKTVKVKLTEDAGGHFKPGFIVTTSTERVHKSGDTEVWGIWDVGRKQWMPDPLKGHIDTSPARYKSKTEAERKADRDWRALNPGERFEVRPLREARRVEAHRVAARGISDDKRQAAFRRLDIFFGSPSAQKRGFPSEDAAANSAATLLASQMKMKYGTAIEVVKEWYRRGGGVAESPRGGHRVADFNSLDALLRHERDENGAKYTYRSPGSVRIYYPDGRGFKEGVAWQEQGYWHAQAPSERVSVTKPPQGSEAIVGKSLMEARRGAAPSPADRRTARGAEARGEQYANDQIQSDYFMEWVREQLAEAARMPPEDVLPLETKSDARVIAKNMLQQLEWDAKRDLQEDDAFWRGFRKALDGSREWLADELLQIKSEMSGGRMHEARPKAKRSAPRRR